MGHANEMTCMKRHERHKINAKMRAHAHAACGPVPVAAVSIDTYFCGKDAGESGFGDSKCTFKHK